MNTNKRMAHSMPGIYAPLPQSLSDSDSEKEVNMDLVIGNFNKNSVKLSTKKNNLSCQHNGHLFNNLSVEINKSDRLQPKLFGYRKAAFCFSLLLCVLPVVIFLWVLPCSDSTCPVKIVNWERKETDIEFKGPINLVYGAFKNTLNLAVMYVGSFNTPRLLKNGVMSYMGRSGAVAWNFEQKSSPVQMNCTIIDVDLNGVDDCLVLDEKLGLKAIEALSGEVLWHAHSAQGKSIPELDMPVKLEDINKDGVDELLSIYQKNTFFLISSKTGEVFFNMKLPSACTSIYNVHKVVGNIRYQCKLPDGSQTVFSLSTSDIIMKYNNPKAKITPVLIHDEDIEQNFISGKLNYLMYLNQM